MSADPDTEHAVRSGQNESVVNEPKTLQQDAEAVARAERLSRRPRQPVAQVPGYSVLRCLGEGAYGSVWLAREDNTGKKVAIKFYTHRRGLDWSLLNREVEKLAVLYTSRNIISLLDVGWDSDPPYYVMEYMENGSLAAHVADGPLAQHESVRIVKSILHALVHAHGSGILHCDLKPANVLLDKDLEPRLCDFGQSRLSYEQDPALGTLFYMAPEQADLKTVPDARWDVYALGALLYHLLCGEPPYRTKENEQLIHSAGTLEERLGIYRRIVKQYPKPNRHRVISGIDKRLADIVDRCLHVDPQKRYPNAQAVLDTLELRDRQRSRRPLIVLGGVGPALLLVAMFLFALDGMQTYRQAARDKMTQRALQGAAVTVEILASSIESMLEDRLLETVDIAADLPLRAAIQSSEVTSWSVRKQFIEIFRRWKEKIDKAREQQGRQTDTSWFLTDSKGYQRWRQPHDPNTINKCWNFRDYFHGRDREYPSKQVPDDIEPIHGPHISLPFRSRATNRFMVAISVPVWDVDNETVIGVLGRTTHLGDLLTEHEPRIRGRRGEELSRIIALVDNRNGNLLAHPWMKKHLESLPNQRYEALTLKGQQLERLRRLHSPSDNQNIDRVDRYAAYEDPVGSTQISPKEYGGPWLAAFCPVGKTDWTAVVQERKKEALKPIEQLQEELKRYAWWALVVSCLLIGTLWYLVLKALNDPSLRLWTKNRAGHRPDDSTVLGQP